MTLPPPLDDSCRRFAPEFDGGSCEDIETCEEVICECSDSDREVLSCNENFGCLVALDCDAYCDAGPTAAQCTATYMPCSTDDDCGEGFCVIYEGNTEGECTTGEERSRCRKDAHCIEGSHCISTSGGRRYCSVEDCNFSEQCGDGGCRRSSIEFVGKCHPGLSNDLCYADDQCADGHQCFLHPTRGYGYCSSGEVGDACMENTDCASEFCAMGNDVPLGTCSDGTMGKACETVDDCDDAAYCAESVNNRGPIWVCSDGEPPNAPCRADDQCTTGMCAGTRCTDGTLNSLCANDDQCQDGLVCRNPPAARCVEE